MGIYFKTNNNRILIKNVIIPNPHFPTIIVNSLQLIYNTEFIKDTEDLGHADKFYVSLST
jgi:hypothetical protein